MESSNYESLKNAHFIPSEAREAWVRADQVERTLRDAYQRLENDEDLTPEAKQRRAAELLETQGSQVEERRKKARETLLKHAGYAEKNSIPCPSGEGLTSTDVNKILLDQNEANRIVRTVERRQSQGGPFKQSSADILTAEYRRGLELGGFEGGAICRGVLRAAGEFGVSAEEVVGPLRSERHNESLDNARRLLYAADLISTDAPQPPRSLTGRSGAGRGSGGSLLSHRPAPVMIGGERETIKQSAPSHGPSKRKKRSFK